MIELSVIIPTCNRGDLLQQAVMSVVAQQLANYEIIIVDDSTAPQQPLFLQQLMVSAPIRYVVNNGAHGAANARNFGVQQAQGAFITFLDDDDLYMPGRLHNMLQVMRSGDYVFVSSGRFYQLNDFNSVQQVPRQLQGVVSLTDIYQANDIDIGFMLKRDTFLALKGFDNSFKNLEDWDFVIRMAQLGNGYKLPRVDYCVNIATDRPRVSDNDWIGYQQILERYQNSFGPAWAAYITASIYRLKKIHSPLPYLRICFHSKSITPFFEFIKMTLKRSYALLFSKSEK